MSRIHAPLAGLFILLLAGFVLTGCAGSDSTTRTAGQASAAETASAPTGADLDRPLPDSIRTPDEFDRAVARGTRSRSGRPGPSYWQQEAEYDLDARLYPEENRLDGTAAITYHNRSPDTLSTLHVELIQNVHREGVVRNRALEITGGIDVHAVALDGRSLRSGRSVGARYEIDGTRLVVYPSEPVMPGTSVDLTLDYEFEVPRQGQGGRMGRSRDNLFYLGYWYPQMAAYDDVSGWEPDHFKGEAEFYTDFADYDIALTAPEEWLVVATGTLQNPEEVLVDSVRFRLDRAVRGDEVVTVVGEETLDGDVTRSADDGLLTWQFRAERVRDAAVSLTTASRWDATRSAVGDRDGDGTTDYTRIDAIYRNTAPLWTEMAEYGRHAISYHSDRLGLPYPWPHMTIVEGGGIIGGGMEYPMMTLIGDYRSSTDTALYAVTSHEISHMWIPMIVNTDERRFAWMDEGHTTFNENVSKHDYFPGVDFHRPDREDYLELAGDWTEGETMRWSNYHYLNDPYWVASYDKPATVLVALRRVLGTDTFNEAYRQFYSDWAYRHPYPFDFFNTIERVAGRDLDWFWHSWYYETWTLDQAVDSVRREDGTARIVIEDRGRIPMPVYLTVVHEDGTRTRRTVPVETWLEGRTRTSVSVESSSPVVRVEIDEDGTLPDVDRSNNVWSRGTGGASR